jgi:hypothetical protein
MTPETNALFSFFDFLDRMLFFRKLDDRRYLGYETGTSDMFDDIINKNHFNNFVDFLASADVPANLKYLKVGSQNRIFFSYEKEQESKTMIDFWSNCSTGMKSLSVFFYWIQNALYNDAPPSFIFIDEFDAFYHQRLAEYVIKTIKKINNCQFILTTHDTGVMANDIMRPDCLFLMYKDKIKAISALTKRELRYAHNIEKMYRARAFDE